MNETNYNLIVEILPDNLFDSKDWKSGGVVERVKWLLAMYKNVKEERDEILDQLIEINGNKK